MCHETNELFVDHALSTASAINLTTLVLKNMKSFIVQRCFFYLSGDFKKERIEKDNHRILLESIRFSHAKQEYRQRLASCRVSIAHRGPSSLAWFYRKSPKITMNYLLHRIQTVDPVCNHIQWDRDASTTLRKYSQVSIFRFQ